MIYFRRFVVLPLFMYLCRLTKTLLTMKFHHRLYIPAIILCAGSPGAMAQLSFQGNPLPAVTETPDASTGLKAVYVLHDMLGVKASYTAASASSAISWKRFSQLGGGFAEEIPFTRQGNVTTVDLTSEDMGFIVEENGRQTCYYVINYANHPCTLSALDIAPERDCTSTALTLHGSASRISYYTVAGAARELSRDLLLEYNTLAYSTDQERYLQSPQTMTLASVNGAIHCPAPLCDTEFHLSGDRFLRAWGMEQSVSSPSFATNAIDAVTSAIQAERDVPNEQTSSAEGSSLGGSAPAEITFRAAVTDAVVFREWQLARDDRFDLIDMRVNDDEFTYTFNEYGTTYARFVCGNADGSCDFTSETYTIYIGDSRLECPNAFSPNDDGVNDEWRVSYKSIIDFDCHIFNRWGQEMAHLTDPSQGWDGRYGGKVVPPGAYYYVIKAEGADGKKYKLSGDINIVGYSSRQGTAPSEPAPTE